MEPRFFKRGNRSRTERANPVRDSFNGATFFQTWKWWFTKSRTRHSRLLQWSHVFSNVEILFGRDNLLQLFRRFNGATFFQTWKSHEILSAVIPRGASMEPRFFKRGNTAV